MEITFVGPVRPLSGGISHHSSRLVEALRAKGHDVRVLSWAAQYPSFLYKSSQLDESADPFPGAEYDLKWWSIRSWLRARAIAEGSQLFVFPYVTPFLAFPQRVMSGRARTVVAIVHNARPHEKMPMEGSLARMALGRASLLVTHGEGIKDDLRELGIGGEVEVIPMPPTLEISPKPLPPRPPIRLLFVGYVRPYKGLGVAISSVGTLKAAGIDVTLSVIGEFWDSLDMYRSQVAKLGLEGLVDLRPGYASDSDIEDALSAHHIVLAPYLEDTLSAVVPLAFAAGRCVVSTTVRGVSEQVQDGVNGILAQPGDASSFADGISVASAHLDDLAKGALASSATWARVATAVTDRLDRARSVAGGS